MNERVGSNLKKLGQACLAGTVVLGLVACGALYDQKKVADAPAVTPGSGNVTGQQCDQEKLVSAALTALDNNCYSCHGAGGTTQGGPKDVTDLAGMVASGAVIPNDAASSPLVKSMKTGGMPPKGNMSQADMDAIAAWINAGAPVLKGSQLTTIAQACVAQQQGQGGTGTGTGTGAGSGGGTGGGGSGLALTAQGVLQKYCAACHDGGKTSGGLGTITDLQSLPAQGAIIPGDPSNSKIIKRMNNTSDPMPPAGKPAPTTAEIQAVAAWIAAGANPNTNGGGGGGGASTQKLTPEDVFTLVAQDLQKVAATSSSPAPFTRYISFAHLAYQGVSASDIKDFTNGAGRILNSLSLNDRITKPVAIDPAGQIIRFDIRDYKWSQQNWEDILRSYPYFQRQRSISVAQTFREFAQTDLPVVNGDWFAFQVTQPPLYNELLQLGNNENALERLVGINITQDIQNTVNDTASTDQKVLRAGFAKSGVAVNNRIIERHPAGDGAYWRSYDFATFDPNQLNSRQQAQKNVFASPLGSSRDLNTPIAFREDAGEIIFSLPNGLFGYFIVDANTNKLDVAALNVAEDPSRPHDKSVITGFGCMNCHAVGILNHKDEILPYVNNGGGFTADELTLIRRLYAPVATMDQAMKEDTDHYLDALKEASLDPSATTPLVRSGQIYEKDITIKEAAAVVGVTAQDFQNLLSNSSSGLKQALAGLVANTTVTRQVFEQQFPQLVKDFFGNIPAP